MPFRPLCKAAKAAGTHHKIKIATGRLLIAGFGPTGSFTTPQLCAERLPCTVKAVRLIITGYHKLPPEPDQRHNGQKALSSRAFHR